MYSLTFFPARETVTLNVPLLIAVDKSVATVFRSGSCLGFTTSPIGGGRSSNVNRTVMWLLFT